MSGRHRNDFPEGADEGGYDPSTPVFGPAIDGSADWFGTRDGQSPPGSGTTASGETPHWFTPRQSAEQPVHGPGGQGSAPEASGYGSSETGGYGSSEAGGYGSSAAGGYGSSEAGGYGPSEASGYGQSEAGGYGSSEAGGYGSSEAGGYGSSAVGGYGSSETGGYGSSEAGGYGSSEAGGYGSSGAGGYGAPGNGYGSSEAGGYQLGGGGRYGAAEPVAESRQGPPSEGPSSPLAGTGYSEYDSIRSSGEHAAAGYGGGSGGYGGGGDPFGGGSGESGGPGGYGGGPGDYEYGRRRRKRGAGALIGPMAGAAGLALLLGVGVYAFAESGGCTGDGAMNLTVAAAPDIAPVVEKAAERFNDGKHKADGKCVRATVRKAEPSSVSTLLSGQGVANPSNTRPDVWIPDSSLWLSLARSSDDKSEVAATKTSVATSPIVVGLPRTLAAQLRNQGVTASPSWDNLLKAAGGVAGGAVTKNQMIPAGTVRLIVPDPMRNAAGMGSLMITSTLLANDPNRDSIFTGIVRTVRESTVPTVPAEFKHFRKGRAGKQPISLSSEQALWAYNQTKPDEPAVALYPLEGTLSMDYPFTVTSEDAGKRDGARLLEKAMTTEATRSDVHRLGFRTPDGKAPTGFDEKAGVSPARPRQLPAPKSADVTKIMQAWSKLTLGLRMLTLIDVSGSMAEQVGPNLNRLQAIAQVSQGGLSMMSDDTELGQWLFSTNMNGDRPYKEVIPIGALSDRIGSTTRRGLFLSTLNQMKPKPNGDTGLYRTLLAAYRSMNRTYKPEFGNSILLLTDGKNDDAGGPSLQETLRQLNGMQDPNKPIQVNMIGFGNGVDRGELTQIAQVTNGSVQIATTPEEIKKIFLKMLSRRIQ